MSYDPRFDRYRSQKATHPKPPETGAKWGKRSRRPVSRLKGVAQQQPPSPPNPPPARSSQLNQERLYAVWGILMVGGFGLALNLFRLQISQGPELQKRAQQQQVMQTHPFVPRRSIIDRNGDILAIDRPAYTLYAHPKLFKQPKEAIASKLAPALADGSRLTKNEGDLLGLFNSAPSGIKIADSLSEEVANKIKNLLIDGLELVQSQQRFYPQQDLAADIVGYVDSDRQGQAGVEYSQQNLLERTMPALRFRRAMNGAWVPEKLAMGFVQFDDLQMRITLDNRLQRIARSALRQQMQQYKAQRAALLVMDVRNGELLSLVTEPSYDPNQYYKFELERFKNWAVADVYEPGSTFKPINVAIALEAGAVRPDSVFNDEGRIFVDGWPIANYDYENAGGRGASTVTDILKHSSNVGMVHIMQQVPASVYYKALERLGLGQAPESDLPFEVPSQLKSREQFVGSRVEPATTAFGQGFSLTPLQLIQLIGSLGNHGKLVTPHVVRGLFNSQGQPYWEMRLPAPKQVFSPQTAKQVLEMMEAVVKDGTGKAAQIPGYRIAGKTGTAQKAKGGVYSKAIIASFVGILPVESPRYAVLAVFDEPQGGSGGLVAAPAVKSVMEGLIALEKIPPSELKKQP